MRLGLPLIAGTALAILVAAPARADDTTFEGRWSVDLGAIVEISKDGDRYSGRLVEKSDASTICWPVDEIVIHLSGCVPQLWSRAGPPPSAGRAVPWWLIGGAALVLVTAAAVAAVLARRARRRLRLALPQHITLQPNPGALAPPTVHVPAVPGVRIRIEARLDRGEPVVLEART